MSLQKRFFNEWVMHKLEASPLSRRELCNISGVSYSSLCKKFQPRLANLVLICETLNEAVEGDSKALDALIIEAIANSSREYRYAKERIEKGKE